ncbi:MAG: hypothetical protein NC543_15310 [bacterium]|nr:hypothetical protein [bacterium]MCM1376733.1 hypothetical protein [Muribaculum sp.]
MTDENHKILKRINDYGEQVMGDIDPQKVPVSAQIEKLRPILQEIADERNISLEDMFILYMDIQSEASCATQQKLSEDLQDLNDGNGMPILIR